MTSCRALSDREPSAYISWEDRGTGTPVSFDSLQHDSRNPSVLDPNDRLSRAARIGSRSKQYRSRAADKGSQIGTRAGSPWISSALWKDISSVVLTGGVKVESGTSNGGSWEISMTHEGNNGLWRGICWRAGPACKTNWNNLSYNKRCCEQCTGCCSETLLASCTSYIIIMQTPLSPWYWPFLGLEARGKSWCCSWIVMILTRVTKVS